MARKILLADDSVTAQNMGRKILADAGYEVIAVNNGSAALKKIAELKPDLVILDVYMPGYSGLEVCQRLKDSPETARIPVLLTVGKLEPFKPEEAQRVRAEGYIVKPFEASELLSALSKLEDKIVPRAEPSKPGRFARAIAAAEESGRSASSETPAEQKGWKSRIGFPHAKPEPEPKIADDSAIYNPMNRDLRTVVETPAEKAGASLDVAALASAGLPKDVTPEEVAAIAAAAAQMRSASAAGKDEHQASETSVLATSPAALETNPEKFEENPPAFQDEPAALPEAAPTSAASEIYGSAEAAATATGHHQIAGESAEERIEDRAGDRIEDRIEELQDAPVTIAATAESVVSANTAESRWTAVPVALVDEDAAISLDQEMQKAQAAFVAEADSVAAVSVPEPQSVSSESVSSETVSEPAQSAVETPLLAVSAPESQAIPEPVPATDATAMQEEQPVTQSDAATTFEADAPVPMAAEVAPVEAIAETPAPELETPNQVSVPVAEFMAPVSDAEVAGLAGLVGLGAEVQEPAPQAEPPIAETTATSSRAFAPIDRATEQVEEQVEEQVKEQVEEQRVDAKPESETVKSTAAAWASWRQIRDTSKGNEIVQAQPREFDVPESAPPATNAKAVAAGAEQISQEASTAAPTENPPDVASIVDSVLADLRPKLMAEISRKMAEKK